MNSTWRRSGGAASVIIGIILLSTLTAVPISGELEFHEFPEFKIGDYFKYKVVADRFVDEMGEDIGGDDYIGAEDISIGNVELRVTGEELVTVDGVDYSCYIGVITWEMEFTLLFEEGTMGTDDDKVSYHLSMETKGWDTKSNQTTVKVEDKLYMEMRFKDDGEDHLIQMESITKEIYTSHSGVDMKFPLTVGSTWTESSTHTANTTERSKVDDDDWEIEYIEEEVTKTTEYEVLGENRVSVEAGSFKCLKIKSQDHGESEYDVDFYDRNGIWVKGLIYSSDGTLNMSMELCEYKMTNAVAGSEATEEEPGYIPGFKIIPVTIAISTCGFWLRKRNE